MKLKILIPIYLLSLIFTGTLYAQSYLSASISTSRPVKIIVESTFPEDEGFKSYRLARKYIYHRNWDRAIEELNALKDKYPKSKYIDASYFWLGYCLNKQDLREGAFDNLEYLVENFPRSPWRDDAQVLMVEIAEILVRRGKLKYGDYLINNINRRVVNINVRLMTFNSLLNLKKELTQREKVNQEQYKAFQQLDKSMKEKEKAFRKQIQEMKKLNAKFLIDEIVRESLHEGFIDSTAFILNRHFKEESIPVILEIAQKDPNPKMRSNAVLLISQVGGEKSFKPLVKIYSETQDTSIKQHIVISFGRTPSTISTKELSYIARNEKNLQIREDAIFWLGRQNTKESLGALANTYYAQKSEKLKRRIIDLISQQRSDAAKKYLTNIAAKEKNKKLKDYAYFVIKQLENKKNFHFYIEN